MGLHRLTDEQLEILDGSIGMITLVGSILVAIGAVILFIVTAS